MRLKIATLIVLMATLGHVMAQDTVMEQSKYYSSKPNQWFVGAGVGAQVYVSYDNFRYGAGKAITPAFSVTFGKMFNPKYGLRGQLTGYQVVMFTDYNRYTNTGTQYFQKYRHNYVGLNADFYMNLRNILWPRSDSRWNWMAFAGPGIEFASPNVDRLESLINISAGMGVKYQYNKSLSLDLEARYIATSSLFLNQGRSSIDGIGMLTAGVNYYFGGSKHKCPYKDKYVSEYTQNAAKSQTISEQNLALGKKTKEIQDLQSKLAACNQAKVAATQTPLPAQTTTTVATHSTPQYVEKIQFQPNSAKLTAAHYTQIETIAKKMAQNPNAKIAVISYGDYNPKMSLSESTLLSFERGSNIIKILKEKYKLDARRIRFVNKGDYDKSSEQYALMALIMDDNE